MRSGRKRTFWPHLEVLELREVPAGLSDFNGDGFDDLVIGVPQDRVGLLGSPGSRAGAVNVIYGSAGGLTATGDQLWHQDVPGIEGAAETGDKFGAALSWGDFNGDGFDDLAIGVPREDVGSVVDAGAVNVIYGSASGLSATGNQLWHQNVSEILGATGAGDFFGSSLVAGDFNGDGVDDLAIGIPGEDVGSFGNTGAVNVVFGSFSGLTAAGNQLWHQNSAGIQDTAQAGDLFGRALAAGDFNGDGRDDLAVGVPGEDVLSFGDAGAVNVIHGSESGLTTAGNQIWSVNSSGMKSATPHVGAKLGSSLAAGDFNADGRADLAIGSPHQQLSGIVQAGTVNVLFGISSGLTAFAIDDQYWHQNVPEVMDILETGDHFGSSLRVGDFNGDGFDDLAIGASGENLGTISDAGAMTVLYGRITRLTASGSQLWHQDIAGILGVAEGGDGFGQS
jgi:hypothetical protein